MLKGPKLSGPAEACLNFIENQQGIVRFAPGSKLLNVFDRSEIRADPLVRFEHDARHVAGCESLFFDRRQKQIEARILCPKPVWKGDLHNGGIFVHDPSLLPRNPARLLGSKRATVKASFSADDSDLLRPTFPNSVRPRQFDRAFGRL